MFEMFEDGDDKNELSASYALKDLADHLWRSFVATRLVEDGAYAQDFAETDMRDAFGRHVIESLRNDTRFEGRLLLHPGLGQRRGLSDEEHYEHEAEVYAHGLMRPLTIQNRSWGGFSNLHRLLAQLLRYSRRDPGWRGARLLRRMGPVTAPERSGDPLFNDLATRLWWKYQLEQERVARLGAKAAYGRNSVSTSWITGRRNKDKYEPGETPGTIHLCIGALEVAVPEELTLPDLFDCLPAPVLPVLMAEYRAGESMLGEMALQNLGRAGLTAGKYLKAFDTLHDRADGPPGWQVYWLFHQVIHSLNDKYANLVAAGLPSNLLEGDFSDEDFRFFRDLRRLAHRLCDERAGRQGTAEDFLAAWRRLAGDGRLPKRYLREVAKDAADPVLAAFDIFKVNEEGASLLDPRRAGGMDSLSEVQLDDMVVTIAAWRRKDWLTPPEAWLAEKLLRIGVLDDSWCEDIEVMAELTHQLGDNLPYHWLPAEARFPVFRGYFERVMALLLRRCLSTCLPPKAAQRLGTTLSEARALEIEQRFVLQYRSVTAALAQFDDRVLLLERDNELADRLASEEPYRSLPEDERFGIFLYFYYRDVSPRLRQDAEGIPQESADTVLE